MKKDPEKQPVYAVSGFMDAHASDGLRQLLFRGNMLVIERSAQSSITQNRLLIDIPVRSKC